MQNKNSNVSFNQHYFPYRSEDYEFIQELTIPKYITKYQTSESRRRKYYRKRTTKNKGDKKIWKPRTLPKTKRRKLEEGIWSLDAKGYLRDEYNNKVLANPKAAGTPNYEYYNGNRFSSGTYHHHLRNDMVDHLKDFYRPFVQQLKPIDKFPIRIDWIFQTTMVDNKEWDASNMWFYYKYFEDTLKDENIIPDDNWKYITCPDSPVLSPVKEWKNRAFIFQFYYDNRLEIKSAKQWKQ